MEAPQVTRKRHPALRRFGLTLLWLACVGAAFVGGYAASRYGLVGKAKELVRLVYPAPTPTPQFPVVEVIAPRLEIALSDAEYARLVQNRDSILASGQVLRTEPAEVLAASVRLDAEAALTATVQLKGTQVTHIRDPHKWSLRIDVAGDGQILGMQHFTIHHPRERNYLDEWYYLRALQQEGLAALQYDFVRVTLHGEDLGVYAVEELPEPSMLARSGRPAGPLLRFDQTALLQEWVRFGDALKKGVGTGAGTLAAAEVQPFYPEALATGTEQERADYIRGASLLDAFRRGEASASQAFDVPLMARFLAVTDLFGSWHGLNWNNLRLYYNPESARLEPVGYDTNAGDDISDVGLIGQGIAQFEFDESRQLIERLFADAALARAYVAELTRLSDPAWLGAYLAAQHDDAQRNYSLLYGEFPAADYTTTAFARNAEYIRKVLSPNTAGLQAWFVAYQGGSGVGGGTVTLMLGNLQRLPVEPLGVVFQGVALKPVPTFAAVVLPARRAQVELVPYTCYWPQGEPWSDTYGPQLTVTWRLAGAAAGTVQTTAVSPWPYPQAEAYRIGPVYALRWVSIDQDARTVTVQPGAWTLSETVRIPADYTLIAGPGTTIDIQPGGGIVSRGPVRLLGDADAPVVLRGSGGGLAIVEAAEPSVLQNVLFERVDGPQMGGVELPGALTLLGSAAELADCAFVDTSAISAVHLFASEARATRLQIAGQTSGELRDVDASGAVRLAASAFDGIDISIAQVDGAALSAGLGSAVALTGLIAQRCETGLASASGANVDARDVTFERCERDTVVLTHATLTLDGVDQPPTTIIK